MAATSQQGLPCTIDGYVPRHVRLYVLRVMFEAGGEYSQAELAQKFDVSDDTIRRDLDELQSCEYIRLPLVCRVINEKRWKLMEEGSDGECIQKKPAPPRCGQH